MFAQLQPVATDPILGLMAAYKEDPNPNKVDLGVGVYKDENGHTAVLKCVKEAEALRLKQEDSKTYIGMAGDLGFNSHIEKFDFGTGHIFLLAIRVTRHLLSIKVVVTSNTWVMRASYFCKPLRQSVWQ